MSSSVDDRIVNMKFNNSTFESGVKTTLNTLSKLKESLNFSTSKKGLDDLQQAGNRFNMNGMANATDGISKKFLAMSTVAITAIANITNRAVNAGIQLVKSFTITPVIDGFKEYQTNLNSVQTIMANTGANVQTVNKYLNELNKYSDQTIYNFSQMARNIGTFTAAGVDLKTATASIKGIANLAALSGSSSEQASTAMYQLSQAIAAGKVGLQDWNSVVNAGMGGKVFQTALARTGQAMGTINDGAIKMVGPMHKLTIEGKSFRESIQSKPGQKAWLTGEVLVDTLKQISGGYTDAELKAKGFTTAQIKQIDDVAQRAFNAATQIKSLPQLMDVIKESIGSSFAQAFSTILGNFNQAKNLWSNVGYEIVGPHGALTRISNQFNNTLKGWAKLGGRKDLLAGLGNIFQSLGHVIGVVHDAFREIFPAKTAADLAAMTKNFRDFTENLKMGGQTSENLKRTFAGFFAVLDIGWQIIRGLFGVIGSLFGEVGKSSGGILAFTGSIGDMLVRLDEAIKKGEGLQAFFHALSTILKVPIQLIGALAGALADAFSGGAVSDGLGRINDRLSPMAGLLHAISSAWDGFLKMLSNAGIAIQPLLDKMAAAFGGLGPAIADAMSSGNFSKVFDVLNTVLLGGILLLVKRFLKDGFSIKAALGFSQPIEGMFSQLTDSMKAMQTQIQAKTLMLIAGAIGLLTASVVALSLIDSDKLTKALTAMGAGFALLLASMAVLVKISGNAGFVKVPLIAASMVLLAGSIVLLTGAIALMGQLDWATIGKGLVGIGGALVVIAGGMSLMPATLPITAAGLVLVGVGLNAIGAALAIFGNLAWKTIGKGLVGIGGALVIIAGAMQLMPLTLPITAAGLILVAIALEGIAAVAKTFATMSWKDLGKAAVAIAGALLIIAGGLALMSGTLVGSAALIIAAGALAILAPVLLALGSMSWESIAKGLATLAGAFLVIGAAGLLLSPIILPILGVSAAIALLGAGLLAAGVGVLAFATAFSIFVAAGAAGVTVLTATVGAIAGLIPLVMQKFGEGIVAFAAVISTSGPTLVAAFVTVLNSLLDAVIQVTPKIGQAMTTLIQTALRVLRQNFPTMVSTGVDLIVNLLQGIANAIPRIAHSAADIIIAWINAIAKEYPRIIDAGFKALIKFLDGVSKAIDDNADELGAAGARMGLSIAKGMVKGMAGAVGEVVGEAKDLAGKALGAIHDKILNPPFPSRAGMKLGGSLAIGFARGIETYSSTAEKSAAGVAQGALDKLKISMQRMSDLTTEEINTTPVITPVLDLTNVQKDAAKIGSMVPVVPVTATTSFRQASDISASMQEAQAAKDASSNVDVLPREVKFEQNNYSPEALSTTEIYRRTNNQLSMAKKALGIED